MGFWGFGRQGDTFNRIRLSISDPACDFEAMFVTLERNFEEVFPVLT